MLQLTRHKGEKIIITDRESGSTIVIDVLALGSVQVRLGITADKAFLIDREEIHEEKKLGGNR